MKQNDAKFSTDYQIGSSETLGITGTKSEIQKAGIKSEADEISKDLKKYSFGKPRRIVIRARITHD